MASKVVKVNVVVTVSEMVLLILVGEPDGLNFNTLLSRCNYIGHQTAFETNLRSLVRRGKIFAWSGKYHHGKYRGEQVKAKRIALNVKHKKSVTSLNKAVKKINKNLDMKITVLDSLIGIVRKDQRLTLMQIKANLLFVSDAGI